MLTLTHPIFHDEAKARKHFEKLRWPNGPICPHCGAYGDTVGKVVRKRKLTSKPTPEGKKHRPQRDGLYYCNYCDEQFTVTVGTVMERSHVPLNKWLMGFVLMASSKKGISAKQLQRNLGVTYRTAWFLSHRIREAMRSPNASPIGGQNKVVESDETFVGGSGSNVHRGKPAPKKHAVQALVERGGEVRAKHVADITANTLRETLVTQASRKSHLMTDEWPAYKGIGKEFSGHSTVKHTDGEYVRLGGFVHTQSVEGFFSILKCGVYGTFHSVSEAHLQRYVDEFVFRYNNRLTYKRTNKTQDA